MLSYIDDTELHNYINGCKRAVGELILRLSYDKQQTTIQGPAKSESKEAKSDFIVSTQLGNLENNTQEISRFRLQL